MATRFVLKRTSYHGAGAIKEITAEITGRRFKKAFVCSDPDLIKFEVIERLEIDQMDIPVVTVVDLDRIGLMPKGLTAAIGMDTEK